MASENRAIFLVSCIVTFFERTKPASNIENPAAIQKTRNPPTKKRSELSIKTVSVATSVGASCAEAKEGKQLATRAVAVHFTYFLIITLSSYIASSPVSPVRTRTA